MNQMVYNFNTFYRRWALLISITNLTGVFLSYFFELRVIWIVGVLLTFSHFLLKMTSFLEKMPLILGYANWVSITRLISVILLFIFYERIDVLILFSIFLGTILLDGVDGYLARKYNHVSQVGGVLDMETDAQLVLVISWIHVDMQSIGWWLLIPGGFRYFYEILFSWKKEWKEEILPKKIRATIAVTFFITLLIPFITNEPTFIFLLYISGVLIFLSFFISILHQSNFIKLKL